MAAHHAMLFDHGRRLHLIARRVAVHVVVLGAGADGRKGHARQRGNDYQGSAFDFLHRFLRVII